MANISDGRVNVTNIVLDGRTFFLPFYTSKTFMASAVLWHCLIHACLKTKESFVCMCLPTDIMNTDTSIKENGNNKEIEFCKLIA